MEPPPGVVSRLGLRVTIYRAYFWNAGRYCILGSVFRMTVLIVHETLMGLFSGFCIVAVR